MVLEKDHDRAARWGGDRWIIEDHTIYRWVTIKQKPLTDWTQNFDEALKYLIENG